MSDYYNIFGTPALVMRNQVDPEPSTVSVNHSMKDGKWIAPPCARGCTVNCGECRPLDWQKYGVSKSAKVEPEKKRNGFTAAIDAESQNDPYWAPRRRSYTAPPSNLAAMRKLHSEGVTVTEIARRHGMSHGRAHWWLVGKAEAGK